MPNQAAATNQDFCVMNVGGLDRVLRMTIGTILFLITATSNLIGLWGLIGVIPMITGFMSYCPLYAVLGINTCRRSAA